MKWVELLAAAGPDIDVSEETVHHALKTGFPEMSSMSEGIRSSRANKINEHARTMKARYSLPEGLHHES